MNLYRQRVKNMSKVKTLIVQIHELSHLGIPTSNKWRYTHFKIIRRALVHIRLQIDRACALVKHLYLLKTFLLIRLYNVLFFILSSININFRPKDLAVLHITINGFLR